MTLDEIEHKIACNELSAAQVFTQMKQHIKPAPLNKSNVEGLVIERCPFCGKDEYVKAYDKYICPLDSTRNVAAHVICGWCSGRINGETKEEAFAKWTKRAS